MFAQKTSVVTIMGIILVLCCLTACGLSKEEIASLDNAVEQKLQTVTQIFESAGLKAAADYCEKDDKITTRTGTFLINCTIAADFYRPEDKHQIMNNKMVLPVSIYARANDSMYLLDKGWKFRDMTISAFARNEEAYFEPIITKRKNFN